MCKLTDKRNFPQVRLEERCTTHNSQTGITYFDDFDSLYSNHNDSFAIFNEYNSNYILLIG